MFLIFLYLFLFIRWGPNRVNEVPPIPAHGLIIPLLIIFIDIFSVDYHFFQGEVLVSKNTQILLEFFCAHPPLLPSSEKIK